MELQELERQGNALIVRDVMEARQQVSDASQSLLEALKARDEARSQDLQLAQSEATAHLEQEAYLEELGQLTGDPKEALLTRHQEQPLWESLLDLEIRAPEPGIVAHVSATSGELLEANAEILRIVDISTLRFVGYAPESDLLAVTPGRATIIEFPTREIESQETVLDRSPPEADHVTRMVPLFAKVSNPDQVLMEGISARARVLNRVGQHEEVLVPSRCILFDGLEAVVFRRNPSAPEQVIRTPVSLGERNSEFSEVIAGVMSGDALVADGVAQIKQALMNKPQAQGHFHADGTFHESGK